ncbi:MAG: hypothetical protein IT548_03715 [Alphaproteobacteria bacterium]|nr:hypothetical protein [Alphaproteobacteria bacterium]
MSDLGTMLAAAVLADARQAEAAETGRLPTTAGLVRQGLALLRTRFGGARRPAPRWDTAPLPH